MPPRYIALLIVVCLLISCTANLRDSPPPATEPPTATPINLIAPKSTPAAVGDEGWEYQRTATADFDGDGAEEQAILIAQVVMSNERPLWEDGHTWQLYVEEPDGVRTYVYAQFVPFGLVEALLTDAESGTSPTIVIIEHAPQRRLRIYEITYNGPNRIRTTEVAQRDLNRQQGFAGTPN